MADQLQLMLEAERRGILPSDKVALLGEARRRGLVPSLDSIPTGRGGASQIPTEPGANLTTTLTQPSSLLGEIRGGLETIPALASGAVSGIVAPIVGLAGSVIQGKGPAEGERISRQVSQAMTYQPRTSEAQRNVEAVGNALAPLVGVPIPTLNQLGAAAPAAIRAVGDVGRAEGSLIKGAVTAPLEARAATKQAQRVAQSYANAPIIDAAKAAERQGLAVNPAITNPTKANKAKAIVVGPAFEEMAAKNNAKQVTNAVRNDLGVASTEQLTPAVVDKALDVASKPYDVVRKMGTLETPPESISALESLRQPALIGGEASAAAVGNLLDDAIGKLQEGRSGSLLLQDIRSMRRNAQAVYKAQAVNPDPLALAKADTQMSIAGILEDVIDANAPTPKALTEMKAARQRMAQIYDHDRAINYANQTVDPQVYAKLLAERKGNMTGVGADIGTVAATFPDVMKPQALAATEAPKVARSGLMGATGALLGGAVGGYPGAIAGASAGGAAGWIGTRAAAKKMATPSYQATHAVPTDYRPAPSGLRPVEPNVPTNALVPYDYSQQAFTPPNFVMQPNQYASRVTPGMQQGPAALPAPSAEGTLGALRAEDVRRANVSRALGQQAEAQQAAAEAATRKPARGEVILDYDPITGRFKEASQGLKGATPETFSNFGSALETASTKVTSGQRFSMTAAEKVAWDKTRVDLAEVAPGFKSLTDKAIAEKMLDRALVAETATKARQKAQAFEDIAARAADERARQTALANRERMLSLAEDMESKIGQPRPVRGTQQGPKTRAAIRNKLAPKQQSQNALAP